MSNLFRVYGTQTTIIVGIDEYPSGAKKCASRILTADKAIVYELRYSPNVTLGAVFDRMCVSVIHHAKNLGYRASDLLVENAARKAPTKLISPDQLKLF